MSEESDALRWAVTNGDIDTVKTLVEKVMPVYRFCWFCVQFIDSHSRHAGVLVKQRRGKLGAQNFNLTYEPKHK